ncbi:DUF2934 domain-containing protein [Lichenicoccus sp.]|uniref:DUF2934 domain-containing protein n=1 Tax=Lichenicoccus sp. TaxID=2781899 RepID=UPI003D10C6BF
MEERLVDILDGHNRILHVFPVPADAGRNEADCVQEAVKEATHLRLVPDADLPALHGRPHVSRGGRLAPVADVLDLRADEATRRDNAIRLRAYFMWLDEGCPDGRAVQHWLQAAEIEQP